MTNTANTLSTKDISNQVISMDKEYVTRDGRKVQVLTTSRNHKYPVISLVDGITLETHLPNGSIFEGGQSVNDLIEVSKIEEGLNKYDLVMVGDYVDDLALRFFSHYDLDGKACTFINGNYEGETIEWDYCRKATPEEIIANKDELQK